MRGGPEVERTTSYAACVGLVRLSSVRQGTPAVRMGLRQHHVKDPCFTTRCGQLPHSVLMLVHAPWALPMPHVRFAITPLPSAVPPAAGAVAACRPAMQ